MGAGLGAAGDFQTAFPSGEGDGRHPAATGLCRWLAVHRAGAGVDPGCLSVVLRQEWTRDPCLSAGGQVGRKITKLGALLIRPKDSGFVCAPTKKKNATKSAAGFE